MFKTMPGFRYEKNIRRLRQIDRPGRKLGGVNKVGRKVFEEERLGCEAGDCKLRYSYVRQKVQQAPHRDIRANLAQAGQLGRLPLWTSQLGIKCRHYDLPERGQNVLYDNRRLETNIVPWCLGDFREDP